ncbi:MAG: 2-succinyl-5-enolpyruvyl-6-hydroxy-3-cyclohexene-1-carboxylic-acid synthase [Chloroflexota bacterium]|nr:MAG: 2-succinyl-5-enolpyruvyl-6-hydroxy-3-cyclohexene-1-carboxylic-acid synthase [Chloroflexota bacterium]
MLRDHVGAIIEELIGAGVRHIVVSPGSRSTPLAIAAIESKALRVWMNYDERSAAFFAGGIARAERQPVALLCTSGTAAANYLAGLAEARLARVPLVVLTADRPPEHRDSGAAQTIAQVDLYRRHVAWSIDLPPPDAGTSLRHVRATICRAVALSLEPPAGPVHINVPFREPLIPADSDVATDATVALSRPSNGSARVLRSTRLPSPELIGELARLCDANERGLIVVGPSEDESLPAALAQMSDRLGYPILADPLSGLRSGRHDRANVIDTADALLRIEGFAAAHCPTLTIRFGAIPTSKPVTTMLESVVDATHIVVDDAPEWREPFSIASMHVWCDPTALASAIAASVASAAASDRTRTWIDGWRSSSQAARRAIDDAAIGFNEPFEGRVFTEIANMLDDETALFVGNSMPVRDLDVFFPTSARVGRIMGNRGANGIDGVVSSALGIAATGRRVVLVLGDLSAFHDLNGLLAGRRNGMNATIVVVNNDGGGIFSFLPQAGIPDHFETLFGTPHGLDFAGAATLYGVRHQLCGDWTAFGDAVRRSLNGTGIDIIEIRTDRTRNVTLHRAVWARVAAALAEDNR